MAREASKQVSSSERHGESSSSNIDLLSQMPDDLLIEIIRLLPTKEAVRTSVLNKSWRNLWKQIHNITFSSQETRQCSLEKEFPPFDNVLRNLDPSTKKNKFCLRFNCNPTGSHRKLNSYLSWAVKQRVKMLALDIKTPLHTLRKLYPVPDVLFQYQSLVELELRNVAPLNMHIRTASWPLLKGFYFTCTDLNVMDFNNLMESCPLLERLSLVRCEFSDPYKVSSLIRICSTMLKCLKLWDCRVMDDHIDVDLNLPSLVKFSIEMHTHSNGAKQRDLLDAVSHVEEIHIGESHLEAMCRNGIKKSTTVKHVRVEITMDNRKRLKKMAYLISSYTNLQTLVVNFNDVGHSIPLRNFQRVLEDGKVLEDCLSRMLNLKTIHVCGIKALEVKDLMEDTNMDKIDSVAEMSRKMKFKIVRILLNNLIHLEEMWIYVVAKGTSYFRSESDLVKETWKLFEEASARSTLQVTCEPYDSPDWSTMQEN